MVISIECNVVLCELGRKCPQMTAWVELDGRYFCFSALIILTTVPFYRLLALTTCIFSAADFTGIYSAQNLKSRFSLQAVSVNFTLKNECRYL